MIVYNRGPGVLPLLLGWVVVSCRGLVFVDVLEGGTGNFAAVHPYFTFIDLLAGVQKINVLLFLDPEPQVVDGSPFVHVLVGNPLKEISR